MTVAVGFNPRSKDPTRRGVAERRLNERSGASFNRRCATPRSLKHERRGFKAAATIGRSLRDHSTTELRQFWPPHLIWFNPRLTGHATSEPTMQLNMGSTRARVPTGAPPVGTGRNSVTQR